MISQFKHICDVSMKMVNGKVLLTSLIEILDIMIQVNIHSLDLIKQLIDNLNTDNPNIEVLNNTVSYLDRLYTF